MSVKIIKENFKEEVLDSQKPVLIDFYADWCGPCRQMSPMIEELSESRSDVKICKVNVEEQPEIAAEFGVANIPTFVIIKNGTVADMRVGSVSKCLFEDFIDKNI